MAEDGIIYKRELDIAHDIHVSGRELGSISLNKTLDRFVMEFDSLTREEKDLKDIVQYANYYLDGTMNETEYLNALEFYKK